MNLQRNQQEGRANRHYYCIEHKNTFLVWRLCSKIGNANATVSFAFTPCVDGGSTALEHAFSDGTRQSMERIDMCITCHGVHDMQTRSHHAPHKIHMKS